MLPLGCQNQRILRSQELSVSLTESSINTHLSEVSELGGTGTCVLSQWRKHNNGPKLPQTWEPAAEDFYRNCSGPRVLPWVLA